MKSHNATRVTSIVRLVGIVPVVGLVFASVLGGEARCEDGLVSLRRTRTPSVVHLGWRTPGKAKPAVVAKPVAQHVVALKGSKTPERFSLTSLATPLLVTDVMALQPTEVVDPFESVDPVADRQTVPADAAALSMFHSSL